MPPPPEPPHTAGLVLAAGASSRMGANKMRLELDGEPLVRRAARRALEAGLSPVVVVLGREAGGVRETLVGLDCDLVVNPAAGGPTSGSLHLAIRSLPASSEAAVVVLGDMVGVTAPMLREVVEAAGRTAAPLVVSRYGEVEAPPLLFRRELFGELLACEGEGCGKRVVTAHRAEAAYVEWPADAIADVDTPADFDDALRRSRTGENERREGER